MARTGEPATLGEPQSRHHRYLKSRRPFPIAITPLLFILLLLPQIPNQADRVSGSPAQALAQPPDGAAVGVPLQAHATGTPLPPGTVKFSNRWGGVPPSACTMPPVQKNGLSQVLSNKTLSVSIPGTLFLGAPTGSSVTHTYVFYPNGTFAARDSAKNSFAIKPLEGLPQGNETTALWANSTAAFEHYQVVDTHSGETLANVTVSYKTRYQDCQPAGLQITISGIADWGNKTSGDLRLTEDRLFPAREPHVEGQRQFTATPSGPSTDRGDADDRRLRQAQDDIDPRGKARRTWLDGRFCGARQIIPSKVKLRIRTIKDKHAQIFLGFDELH